MFAGNFTGIPTFVGEWAVATSQTEPAARWRYMDFFLRTAAKYGFST